MKEGVDGLGGEETARARAASGDVERSCRTIDWVFTNLEKKPGAIVLISVD